MDDVMCACNELEGDSLKDRLRHEHIRLNHQQLNHRYLITSVLNKSNQI
jgi:hypothetical protein